MSKSVLYIDNTLNYGGAILSLRNLLKVLDRQKFVPVITTGQAQDYLKEAFPATQVYSLNIKLPWVHNRIHRKVLNFRLSQFYLCRKIITVWRYLYWILSQHIPDALRYWKIGKHHNVAIVHLNNILGSQLSGILAAKLLRVPCVAHLRDFERNTLFTRLYARLIDHHIAISSAIRQNLLDLGIPENKITIIHDSLDISEFNPQINTQQICKEFALQPDCVKIGFFGRIVAWKGVREYVEAAAQVLGEYENAVACVVGSAPDEKDPYFEEICQRIKALGLEERILITGYRSDVPQLMAFMDLIVHASTSAEPFGMVVIEGMALAKPVVATAAGGPLDIVIEGETGLLVTPGDSSALGRAISSLLSDAALRSQMGQQARKRVESLFSNSASARKVEQLYEHLVDTEELTINEHKLQESK